MITKRTNSIEFTDEMRQALDAYRDRNLYSYKSITTRASMSESGLYRIFERKRISYATIKKLKMIGCDLLDIN